MSTRDAGLGYLLRMYPRYSQTFIVNEILELERQETSLWISSLRLPNEGVFHESISRVRAPVDYLESRRPPGRRERSTDPRGPPPRGPGPGRRPGPCPCPGEAAPPRPSPGGR